MHKLSRDEFKSFPVSRVFRAGTCGQGTISVPDRCKLQDFTAGLEIWEELVRRYERSKSSGTTTTALVVIDIKSRT